MGSDIYRASIRLLVCNTVPQHHSESTQRERGRERGIYIERRRIYIYIEREGEIY